MRPALCVEQLPSITRSERTGLAKLGEAATKAGALNELTFAAHWVRIGAGNLERVWCVLAAARVGVAARVQGAKKLTTERSG